MSNVFTNSQDRDLAQKLSGGGLKLLEKIKETATSSSLDVASRLPRIAALEIRPDQWQQLKTIVAHSSDKLVDVALSLYNASQTQTKDFPGKGALALKMGLSGTTQCRQALVELSRSLTEKQITAIGISNPEFEKIIGKVASLPAGKLTKFLAILNSDRDAWSDFDSFARRGQIDRISLSSHAETKQELHAKYPVLRALKEIGYDLTIDELHSRRNMAPYREHKERFKFLEEGFVRENFINKAK